MDDNTESEKALIRAIGRQIAAERVAASLTQDELASRAGIAKRSLARYELGEREPQLGTLVIIARVIGVRASEIMLAAEARAERESASGS